MTMGAARSVQLGHFGADTPHGHRADRPERAAARSP